MFSPIFEIIAIVRVSLTWENSWTSIFEIQILPHIIIPEK